MQSHFSFPVPFVRFAQQVQHGPGMDFGPRRLYDHLLLYYLAGEGEIVLEGRRYPVVPDTLFLVPPRVSNRYLTSPRGAQVFLGIHFDWEPQPDSEEFAYHRAAEEPVNESLFRPMRCVPGWDWNASPSLDLRGRPRTGQLLREVVAAHQVPDDYARNQAGALLAAALLQIAREAQWLRDVTLNPHLGADAIRRVHRARELLEGAAPVSVAEAATAVSWSPDHLNRMCRAVFHVTPHALRTRSRLRRARELLSYGNASVSDVAFACGYADTSHFIRLFRQETGLTPHQFARLDKTDQQRLNP